MIVGGILLIVILVVVLSLAVNSANKTNEASGITPAQFSGESLGTTESHVKSDLGKPDDAQQFVTQGIITKKADDSACIYYHQHGQALFAGASYQFCFDNGKLTSKNQY